MEQTPTLVPDSPMGSVCGRQPSYHIRQVWNYVTECSVGPATLEILESQRTLSLSRLTKYQGVRYPQNHPHGQREKGLLRSHLKCPSGAENTAEQQRRILVMHKTWVPPSAPQKGEEKEK